MIPYRVIERKRDGGTIDASELRAFLQGYSDGAVEEAQMAAFLMAVLLRGMSDSEMRVLLDAMLHSGEVLEFSDLPGPVIDKHSTGGVGDKTSLVLAPLAAELGIFVPMMSGRGLGHTGGTLDKLESIPGFRTELDLSTFRKLVRSHGFAMIGQTGEIAPLDRRLYALRSATATVPSIPLIACSIMSKKLAEGIRGLVLDVKTGRGAFLPEPDRARSLARIMVGIGSEEGIAVTALLTSIEAPLGQAIGNGLEIAEAIRCLTGSERGAVRRLSVALTAEMLRLADPHLGEEAARQRVEEVLDSGRPFERFLALVEAQGGDPRTLAGNGLPRARHRREVRLPEGSAPSGAGGLRIAGIDPLALGWGVVELGGGRRRTADPIDPTVGFELDVEPGAPVAVGDRIGIVHAASEADALRGERILLESLRIVNSGESPEAGEERAGTILERIAGRPEPGPR